MCINRVNFYASRNLTDKNIRYSILSHSNIHVSSHYEKTTWFIHHAENIPNMPTCTIYVSISKTIYFGINMWKAIYMAFPREPFLEIGKQCNYICLESKVAFMKNVRWIINAEKKMEIICCSTWKFYVILHLEVQSSKWEKK